MAYSEEIQKTGKKEVFGKRYRGDGSRKIMKEKLMTHGEWR